MTESLHAGHPRRRRLLIATTVIVTSALITLLAAEGLARLGYGEGFIYLVDPELDHHHRHGVEQDVSWSSGYPYRLITNDLGWRDRVVNRKVKKVSTQKRVVFLGDSFTHGVGFPCEDCIGHIVETKLNAAGLSTEVLNGGTSSYSPLLSYMRLKRFLEQGYTTDYVVLLPDLSDVQNEVEYSARYRYSGDGEPLGLGGWRESGACVWLYNHSALARMIKQSVSELATAWRFEITKKNIPPMDSPVPSSMPHEPPHSSVGEGAGEKRDVISSLELLSLPGTMQRALLANWADHPPSRDGWAKTGLSLMQENIRRIRDLCRRHGIELLVVTYPWPLQNINQPDKAKEELLASRFAELITLRQQITDTIHTAAPSLYETQMLEICRELALPHLNLAPLFRSLPDWEKLYIPDDVHFTSEGNAWLGEHIAEELLRRLKTPPPQYP